jgi:hypothetical protein
MLLGFGTYNSASIMENSVWQFLKKSEISQAWGLTPIIPATQEAEIRGTTV